MMGFDPRDIEHGPVIQCAHCLDQPDAQDADAARAEGWGSTTSEGRVLWMCPPHWRTLGL